MDWWSGGVVRFGQLIILLQIIGAPHFPVRAGGADFHFCAGELVEKEGCAPVVHEFASAIDAQTRFRIEEFHFFGVATVQGFGDFGIGTDWVAAEHGTVLIDGDAHVAQDGSRIHRGRSVRRAEKERDGRRQSGSGDSRIAGVVFNLRRGSMCAGSGSLIGLRRAWGRATGRWGCFRRNRTLAGGMKE